MRPSPVASPLSAHAHASDSHAGGSRCSGSPLRVREGAGERRAPGERVFDVLGALREAIEAICEGRCPAALAGAADSWVDDYSLQAWARMGRSDPPGEAAIFFLLEPAGAAAELGRPPRTPTSPSLSPP